MILVSLNPTHKDGKTIGCTYLMYEPSGTNTTNTKIQKCFVVLNLDAGKGLIVSLKSSTYSF